MTEKYDHEQIEKKWQERWAATNAFAADDASTKPKQYILDMFPYPSGDGLHVGHVEGYTATDIYSRYKRMRGFNVLHPMGWDAFGLPAENYAIKTGVPPQETTDKSIANFRRQIQSLGLSYDWAREFGTHQPGYYRWTQWLFAEFFKKGLVYKKKALVNWDPVDQTVLANEQVLPDGTAERSGAKVEKKELEQWFFKITNYADELADSLEGVDWPESTKIAQRNWIGRSEGAEIEFSIVGHPMTNIRVFTTRPDTLFGATYLVLAPEHPLVAGLPAQNRAEVDAYVAAAKNKSDIERSAEGKEKTGVELKGVTAVNPANKEELPVFIADYVLGHYGTGAIMAVPQHDERDREFAKKFGLPIIDKPLVDGREITQKVGGKMTKQYRLRDWLISRQRYWGAPIPVVYDPDGAPHAIPAEYLPWILPTDVEFRPTGTSPLGQSEELLERTERIFGKGWRPEVDTMDTFACSSWYFFRFADPHNDQEFAGKKMMQKWLPVDLYVGGAEHTVLHLLYARFFTKALRDLGYLTFGEPFLKLRHQGIILAEDSRKMSKRWGNVINPDDVAKRFGADAVRLYEMFMGPLEAMKPWNTANIAGVERFLERVWRLQPSAAAKNTPMDATVKKVTDDIESLKFNTAVSALMIALKQLEDAGAAPSSYETFVRLLHPFAPHLTSELAEMYKIDLTQWPAYDPAKLVSERVTVGVQVNGKLRGSVELAPDASQDDALAAAKASPAVAKWLAAGEIERMVYVPGKILSLIV